MRPVTINTRDPEQALVEIERASHENDLAEIAQNYPIVTLPTSNNIMPWLLARAWRPSSQRRRSCSADCAPAWPAKKHLTSDYLHNSSLCC